MSRQGELLFPLTAASEARLVEPQLRYCNQHSSFSDINIVVSVCRAPWDYYIWPPLPSDLPFQLSFYQHWLERGGGVDSAGDKDMPARLSWQSPCQLGTNIKLDNWTRCSQWELQELTTLHWVGNSIVCWSFRGRGRVVTFLHHKVPVYF